VQKKIRTKKEEQKKEKKERAKKKRSEKRIQKCLHPFESSCRVVLLLA
jgi:hypothetical protein